jgi:tetratricopeptide (TPR) repeat protein
MYFSMLKYISMFMLVMLVSATHIRTCFGASDNETSQKNTAKTSLTIEADDSSVYTHIEYPDFLEKLGDLHREEKFAELVEFGEDLLRKNINDLDVCFFLGLAYYYTGNKESALEVFNTGLQSDYMGLPGTFGEKAAISDKALIHYRMHEI